MSAIHPEFAPISIICAILLLLPLPWHWRARNVATLSIIGWLFVCNIIYAVDALVWGRGFDIVIPVWCDITTKIIIGVGIALPAACLCISIHLERVSSPRSTQNTPEDRRRRRWFEAAMCFGVPALFMALHYVVQGHRYDIIEGYGCRPATYYSIAALFIVWIPPMIISCVAVVYAGLALRHFVNRRLAFAAHLNTSNSSLNTTRYLRLMAMAALQMLCSLSFSAYTLWFTAMSVPIRPWTTWADVHSDFLRVDQFPDALIPEVVRRAFYILWWLIPISTVLFVGFFSFGNDAVAEYKKCIAWVRVTVLRSQPQQKVGFADLPMSPTKFPRSSPDSKAFQDKSTTFGSQASRFSSVPPYSSYSTTKASKHAEEADFSDTHSEYTRFDDEAPYDKSKSLDTPSTPSTARTFSSETTFHVEAFAPPLPPPPAPLSPPPPNPRHGLRELILTPSSTQSGRPTSYPAFIASPRSIKPPQPLPR